MRLIYIWLYLYKIIGRTAYIRQHHYQTIINLNLKYEKLFLLLVTIFAISVTALAQSQRVTGIVFGEDSGEPLVGATVMGVGTQTGTVTNIDGVFDMLLPESVKKISVSYVGMRHRSLTSPPAHRWSSTS